MIGSSMPEYSGSGPFDPQRGDHVQKPADQQPASDQPAEQQPSVGDANAVVADQGEAVAPQEKGTGGGGQIPIKNGHVAVMTPGQGSVPQDPATAAKMAQIQALMAKKQAREAARAGLQQAAAQVSSNIDAKQKEMDQGKETIAAAEKMFDSAEKIVGTEQKVADTQQKAVDTKQKIASTEDTIAKSGAKIAQVASKERSSVDHDVLQHVAKTTLTAYKNGKAVALDANNFKQHANDTFIAKFDKTANRWDFQWDMNNKEHKKIINDPAKLAALHKAFAHPHNPGAPVSHSHTVLSSNEFKKALMLQLALTFPGMKMHEEEEKKKEAHEKEAHPAHLGHAEHAERHHKKTEADATLKETILEKSNWQRERDQMELKARGEQEKRIREAMKKEDMEYHENVDADKREQVREIQDPTSIPHTPTEDPLHPTDLST